jgi:hypothetical protein
MPQGRLQMLVQITCGQARLGPAICSSARVAVLPCCGS